MDLKESLKQLPKRPGIYLMKDSIGTVIYVGKAKNLKARVSQYFRKNSGNSPKVSEMIERIRSFEYITTDTELEALLLECRTIRELKPAYNRLLKNCKGYRYIEISTNEDYPGISSVTRPKNEDAMHFGPFASEGCVDNAIQFIKDFFPIRKCSNGTFNKNLSGCLNFHLGNCLAPCRNIFIQGEYRNHIDNIVRLLEGKDYSPVKMLHEKMKSAAGSLDFEKAARYRDQINGVRYVIGCLRVIKASGGGRNILAAERYSESEDKLFLIKGSKLKHTELISFSWYSRDVLEDRLKELITSFFKTCRKEKDTLNQEDIDEVQIIHAYLRNGNNGIRSMKIPSSRIDRLDYGKIADFLLKR